MRAAGAHVSTYHGPLQPRVMCACHRTSPTATALACDGLYSATAAEQRGRNLLKLLSSMACHRASGATPPYELNACTLGLLPHNLNDSRRCGRTCERRSRRGNEDSTERAEADDARARHNAAALAARGQKERLRGGSAA